MLRVVGQMGRLAATPQDLRDELDAPDAHGLSLCHYCALYGLADLVDALDLKGFRPMGPLDAARRRCISRRRRARARRSLCC